MSETTDKLFDILADDQRIIVATDKEAGYIVTWNRSLTLQAWNSDLDEVDIHTLSEAPTITMRRACLPLNGSDIGVSQC
jgi:hypothetical protein